MSTPEVSIIIPVLNEGPVIGRTIHALERAVRVSHEILVVYDFDEDDTVPVVHQLVQVYPTIRAVKNHVGPEIINAVKAGCAAARGEAIVIMTADGSDDPETVNRMYAKFSSGFDLVCGSRYTEGRRPQDAPWLKSQLSRLAGITLHRFTGVPTCDPTNSFKMFRRGVFQAIPIESQRGFEVYIELILKAYAGGFRITEVPTIWQNRVQGESKFKFWRSLPRYARWYVFGLTLGLR